MMTEIKYGAVLMAAAAKQDIKMAHDDAFTVLKYMGLEDQHLMASNGLRLLTLRRYTGGGKFTDTLAGILDVVLAAVKVCENLLSYTLTGEKDDDTIPAMIEFRNDHNKLRRIAARIELAAT